MIKMIKFHTNMLDNKEKKTFIQIIPDYVNLWRTYCKNDINTNIDVTINRMNGIIIPHLMRYRWIELLYHKQYPFRE